MFAIGLNSYGGPGVLHLITLRAVDVASLDRGIKPVFVNGRDRIADCAAIVRLGQQVSTGLLPMRVAATFPAAEASAAHLRLAGGGLRGRIMLDFDALEVHP
jgi:NADPH2:quinone reductase